MKRSRMKLRISRGPNCCDASVSDAIVIEKDTPAAPNIAAAVVARAPRIPSMPLIRDQPRCSITKTRERRESTQTVSSASKIDKVIIEHGIAQNDERMLSIQFLERL